MMEMPRSVAPPAVKPVEQQPSKFELMNKEIANQACSFLKAFGFIVVQFESAVVIGDLEPHKSLIGGVATRIDTQILDAVATSFDCMIKFDESLTKAEKIGRIKELLHKETCILVARNKLVAFALAQWNGFVNQPTEYDLSELAKRSSKWNNTLWLQVELGSGTLL